MVLMLFGFRKQRTPDSIHATITRTAFFPLRLVPQLILRRIPAADHPQPRPRGRALRLHLHLHLPLSPHLILPLGVIFLTVAPPFSQRDIGLARMAREMNLRHAICLLVSLAQLLPVLPVLLVMRVVSHALRPMDQISIRSSQKISLIHCIPSCLHLHLSLLRSVHRRR